MESNTSAIILAGGKSGRMGHAKGLLKYNETFWILEQIHRLSKTSIKEVYIGLGYDIEHYYLGIDWFEKATKEFVFFLGMNVKITINSNPEIGSFSTLQAVLKEISSDSDILICPIDVPILMTSELNKIIKTKNRVVIPTNGELHGHPIKIDSHFKHKLIELPLSNKVARLDLQIKELEQNQVSYVEVMDDIILKNLNTPNEWKSFLKIN